MRRRAKGMFEWCEGCPRSRSAERSYSSSTVVVGGDGVLLHVASVAAATRRLGRAPPPPSTLLGLPALLGDPRRRFRPFRAPPGRFVLVPDASEQY